MSVPAAVVVNAAGFGSRLGKDAPKALLSVAGRPLVAWQLDLLRDVRDVRVVVGYRAAEVADVVFACRPSATVVLNHEFAVTGTAASLMRGARAHPTDAVVSLDCDLVVHPDDLRAFVNSPEPLVGAIDVQSTEPVYVRLAERGKPVATGFGREYRNGDYEWSGLVRFDPGDARLGNRCGHVFELIQDLLPLRAHMIRAREVDYPEEIEAMEAWIESLQEQGAFA